MLRRSRRRLSLQLRLRLKLLVVLLLDVLVQLAPHLLRYACRRQRGRQHQLLAWRWESRRPGTRLLVRASSISISTSTSTGRCTGGAAAPSHEQLDRRCRLQQLRQPRLLWLLQC